MKQQQKKASDTKTLTKRNKKVAWIPWGVSAALILALLLSWWQPIESTLDRIVGLSNASPPASAANSNTGTKDTAVTITTTPTGAGSPGATETVNLKTPTTASTSSGSPSTPSTSNTTTTTSTTSTGTSTTGTSGGGSTPLTNFYDSIGTGLTKNQLVNLAGSGPTGCTDATILQIGTQEVCTWTQNGSSVVVTMLNGQVVAKQEIAS